MILKSISVRRTTKYGFETPTGSEPFAATVEMISPNGEVKLNLDPEMSRRIVEVVADEVAKAGRATADAMVADVLTGQALLAAE